jgi:hypothetical protein
MALSYYYDIELHLVVGVISVLSPNNTWERNLVDAENVLDYFTNAERHEWQELTVSTYRSNRDKAFTILESGRVFPTLKGPKVEAFYHCILGDCSEVCIDSHAINAWFGYRRTGSNLPNVKVTVMRRIRGDYLRLAKSVGKHPREVQATLWLFWLERIEQRKVEGYV